MAERKIVVIDAGHGGWDPGAVYNERQEKDDALTLALAIGKILETANMDVLYTRTNDEYDTPFEKASMANRAGADFLISIHRNAMPAPNSASGVQTLVYANAGLPGLLAENINEELQAVGFADLGVIERPNLVVLNSTQMPAVLVEVGFIDSDVDNDFLDQNFDAITQAIANGLLKTIHAEENPSEEYYQVQVGAFESRELAQHETTQLQSQGFPAFIVYDEGYFKVRVGAFANLDNAVRMEQELRNYGYNTFITRE